MGIIPERIKTKLQKQLFVYIVYPIYCICRWFFSHWFLKQNKTDLGLHLHNLLETCTSIYKMFSFTGNIFSARGKIKLYNFTVGLCIGGFLVVLVISPRLSSEHFMNSYTFCCTFDCIYMISVGNLHIICCAELIIKRTICPPSFFEFRVFYAHKCFAD